jgi:hypothetical protein
MTKEELAKELEGAICDGPICNSLIWEAKENGLVIVYNNSDAVINVNGAIVRDLRLNYSSQNIYFTEYGVLEYEKKEGSWEVEAIWCNGNDGEKWHSDMEGYAWTYKTDIPHACFDTLEDGEKWCQGIVFDKADLKRN